MSTHVRRPSRRLSPEDAIIVWLRHWGGEFQNRIASAFDVNPARVNEVLKGRKYPESRSAALARRSPV